MSEYTRQQDFSVKDGLSSGDPEKIISGADVDEEFDELVTVVATKADRASGHTTNNLAKLAADGDAEDSGVAISTDGTFSADSDAKIPTEKAIADYVGSQFALSFHAYETSNQNVLDGVNTRLVAGTEYHDDGSDYNTATGVYTAPVDGVYQFSAGVSVGAAPNSNVYIQLYIYADYGGGAQRLVAYNKETDLSQATANLVAVSGLVKLTAGETVEARVVIDDTSGTIASDNVEDMYFSGALVYRSMP